MDTNALSVTRRLGVAPAPPLVPLPGPPPVADVADVRLSPTDSRDGVLPATPNPPALGLGSEDSSFLMDAD